MFVLASPCSNCGELGDFRTFSLGRWAHAYSNKMWCLSARRGKVEAASTFPLSLEVFFRCDNMLVRDKLAMRINSHVLRVTPSVGAPDICSLEVDFRSLRKQPRATLVAGERRCLWAAQLLCIRTAV